MQRRPTASRVPFVPLLIAILAVLISTADAGAAAVVSRFSPQGSVKNVRQVTAKFSQPMIPLGDPRAAVSPFDIQCAEHGNARWIDSFTWSFDFDRDLPGGVSCTFNLRPDVKTLKGEAVETRSFSFNTGGPAVVEARPWSGSESIDEQQAFVLMLDAPADEASVVEHTTFSVEGIAERVGAKLVTGADRDILAKRFERTIDKRPFVIVQARQNFPNGAKLTLVWGKGIKTPGGVETTEDAPLEYKVRPTFQARVSCDRENAKAGCIPLTPIKVLFTADISRDLARQIAMVAPDGTRLQPKVDDGDAISAVEFSPPFKESTQYTVTVPAKLTDDSGRVLSNASRFPYPINVDEFPPLAKFSARFGIVESADPVLPVTVRNLEPEIHGAKLQVTETPGLHGAVRELIHRIEARVFRVSNADPKAILEWLRRVAEAKRTESVFHGSDADQRAFAMPKPNGAKAFEVMGIPLKAKGLFVVELKSNRLGAALLGETKPMYVPTSALVTNLAVHFKQGKANSLVWVTKLENAQPVGGAEVVIADCDGDRLWTGRTDQRGIALVPHLDAIDVPPRCDSPDTERESDYYSGQTDALRELSSGLLVTASRRGDFSFVHSSWKNGLESWRFHLPTEYQPSPVIAHTVFDRVLLRAGETVHMKHFVRLKTVDGFGMLRTNRLPLTVTIQHLGDEQKYEIALAWKDDGTATTDWKIPEDAKLGEYDLQMSMPNPFTTADPSQASLSLEPGSFRVEQFRVPLMKASLKLPTEPQVAVSQIPVDVSIAYLTGGVARGLPLVLRSEISQVNYQTFPNFDDFTFVNGPIKEGLFKTEDSEGGYQENPGVHQRKDLTLDAAGGARSDITDIPRADIPQTVRAEVEFRDANGEIKTVSNEVTVWPARLIAGIRTDGWTSSPNMLHARVAVLDDSGKPAPHVPVRVMGLTDKYFSYRKRLVGGFYAYENTREVKPIGPICSGTTDDRGLFFCEAKPSTTGEIVLQASVKDASGNVSTTHASVYVPGADRMWFEGHDDDRIDVISEKPEYQVGEKARFQVRMPFAEATALVTVEREGIIAASVVHLSGKNPVVTLPVRDYAPNAFVSVLAVRGRVAGVAPTSTIDLGKPAFRLGITGFRAGWREHRLDVTVTPDHPVYHVREKAHVKIGVRTADGNKPPPGATVAVAAVDEGLLQLQPNESWKLLNAMMATRPYQIETSSAATQIIGRRHFGLKAIPPGGGGGSRVTRELFDTLLLWQASVELDSSGNAEVEVPLNDSLTSFKIVAIASAGNGDFGTGDSTIRSTQDLQLFSGVSPLARTGDSFPAQFTVRNASDRPYDVDLSAAVEGLLSEKPPPMKVTLAPGDGQTVSWNVAVPGGVSALRYTVDASVPSGPSDHLRVSQQVIPAVPVRTWQATLIQLDKPFSQPIAMPSDAIAGAGGIQVQLSPSLTAGLGSIETWMREYPYICMEQRVSRAVALRDPALWKGIVGDLPSYLDSDGLLKYFPSMHEGSDVLTSYVLAIADEGKLTLPTDAQNSMESALQNFVEGKLQRTEPFIVADLPMRKLAAIEALSRHGKATAELVSTLTIDPNLWPDSAVINWWSILTRTPSLPRHEARLTDVQRIMRARLNEQGAAIHLSTDPRNNLWWLMVSPEESTVRLLLLLLNSDSWHDDIPRVMRGALALQQRGSWPSTIANAWGVLAIEKFASVFEAQPVTGEAQASIGSVAKSLDWSSAPKGGVLGFDWPPAPASVDLAQKGTGSPWAQISASAAIPLKAPFTSGYAITRTLAPVDSNHKGEWKAGDLVRVHLTMDAQTDMTWVVVDDPIPAGASQVGVGLASDSKIATAGENQNNQGYTWPSFIERSFGAFRAYYDYVPKGKFEIEYTIRLNQAGTFQLPPTHVAALYEPEMLGELPNAAFQVTP